MRSRDPERAVGMGREASYRLVVEGDVARRDLDRLGELRSTPIPSSGGRVATELEGRVRDQAQLLGVLNGLYEMGLPILKVDMVE